MSTGRVDSYGKLVRHISGTHLWWSKNCGSTAHHFVFHRGGLPRRVRCAGTTV